MHLPHALVKIINRMTMREAHVCIRRAHTFISPTITITSCTHTATCSPWSGSPAAVSRSLCSGSSALSFQSFSTVSGSSALSWIKLDSTRSSSIWLIRIGRSPSVHQACTMAEIDGEDQPQVDVFVVRCPFGDQCSKRQGVLGKRLSESEARSCIVNHLTGSPYHDMAEAEAIGIAESSIVESWQEAHEDVEVAKTDEGDGWYQNRKRPKQMKISLEEAQAVVRRSQRSSGSSDSHAGTLSLPIGGRNNTKKITLERAQLKACVDSLKRARMASESAGQLCGRASRAFYEEAACITNCQDVLESYLAE
jgi:hypothetical protein